MYSDQKVVIKIIKNCIICGEEYKTYSKKQKYCSIKCAGKDRPTYEKLGKKSIKIEKICLHCRKYFKIFPSSKNADKYCSKKCSILAHTKDLIEKTCESCGKKFKVKPHRKDYKYCSKDCRVGARRKEKIPYPCDNCGIFIYLYPHEYSNSRMHHFCKNDRKCWKEYIRKNPKLGIDNPNYKHGKHIGEYKKERKKRIKIEKIKVKCNFPGCNNIKLLYLSEVKQNKRHYCCREHLHEHLKILMSGSGNPMYGISLKLTDEQKKAKSKKSIEMWQNPEYRKKVIENAKKVTNTLEYREKRRQETQTKWDNPNSIFYTQKYRENLLKGSNTPEIKKLRIKIGKRNWKNPEIRKKMLKSFNRKPTNPEKIFDELTPECVRYVGNGKWWRKTKKRYRNPDFKITGQNKVIEIYGNYWHDIFKVNNGRKPDNPKDKIREYARVGIECIVFWEYEILKVQGYPEPNLGRVLKETLEFIEAESKQ